MGPPPIRPPIVGGIALGGAGVNELVYTGGAPELGAEMAMGGGGMKALLLLLLVTRGKARPPGTPSRSSMPCPASSKVMLPLSSALMIMS